jgi:rod shape-determining protein MreD
MLYYRKTLFESLWISFGCGLLLDILASKSPFGFYALTYTLTAYLLFHQRRHFFADHITTLPLMTFFFAAFLCLVQSVFLYVFEKEIVFSWQWITKDLIIDPAINSGMAFLCFVLPWMGLRGYFKASDLRH